MSFDALPTDDGEYYIIFIFFRYAKENLVKILGSHNYKSLLVRSGLHVVPSEKIKNKLSSVITALRQAARLSLIRAANPDRISRCDQVGVSLASLVGLAIHLSSARPLSPGTRLLVNLHSMILHPSCLLHI